MRSYPTFPPFWAPLGQDYARARLKGSGLSGIVITVFFKSFRQVMLQSILEVLSQIPDILNITSGTSRRIDNRETACFELQGCEIRIFLGVLKFRTILNPLSLDPGVNTAMVTDKALCTLSRDGNAGFGTGPLSLLASAEHDDEMMKMTRSAKGKIARRPCIPMHWLHKQ
ncbi:uncharacterized protein ARMOST_17518 [Armillaria ostoyae]|uniref:Uncharacterized protein n=1 Tax=Armillaria ostoyae TaxID=47428 RepID=A0A284RZ79_ARMOS|nr:uncharacterized protein ARMOST_17518 [Armillaria ostoyae]